MEIKGIIEKGKEGLFSVRSEAKIGRSYLGGFGESVEDAKRDFTDSLKEAIEQAKKDGYDYKDIEELRVVYSYDCNPTGTDV